MKLSTWDNIIATSIFLIFLLILILATHAYINSRDSVSTYICKGEVIYIEDYRFCGVEGEPLVFLGK